MRLDIESDDVELTREVRTYVELRVRDAIDHRERRVGVVAVRLWNERLPGGRAQSCCRMVARLESGGATFAARAGGDLWEVIDANAEELGQLVAARLAKATTRAGGDPARWRSEL